MGKNNGKRRTKTEYSVRKSSLAKVDNYIRKMESEKRQHKESDSK